MTIDKKAKTLLPSNLMSDWLEGPGTVIYHKTTTATVSATVTASATFGASVVQKLQAQRSASAKAASVIEETVIDVEPATTWNAVGPVIVPSDPDNVEQALIPVP